MPEALMEGGGRVLRQPHEGFAEEVSAKPLSGRKHNGLYDGGPRRPFPLSNLLSPGI